MLDVLLVDDDDIVRESIADALQRAGHRVTEARDGEEAANLVDVKRFDLAICDVHMPKMDGITLFRRVKRVAPTTAVVIMTTFGKIPDAIASLRDGAVDYITKPFDPDELAERIVRPIDDRIMLRREIQRARAPQTERRTGGRLVAESLCMQLLVEQIRTLAQTDVPVMISGDRGTGKKLLARVLHAQSPRKDGPLVIVPCTSLPDLMLESELRELSEQRRAGGRDSWFKNAEGGTLVLDGIDSLSIAAQSSLLRVIQEPETVARKKGNWQPSGVRIVAVARKSVSNMVLEERFLEPLYFRLNAMPMHVPPLRERPEDLLPLVAELLDRMTPRERDVPLIEPRAWKILTGYPFPGNAHEVEWALEHALTLANGNPIDVAHLPTRMITH